MRVLRGVAAALLSVLASVLLLVGVLLCLTVILLPVGVLVAFAAVRLYRTAAKLLLPRNADLKRGLRKSFRVRELRDALGRAERQAAKTRKRLRKRARVTRRRLAT